MTGFAPGIAYTPPTLKLWRRSNVHGPRFADGLYGLTACGKSFRPRLLSEL